MEGDERLREEEGATSLNEAAKRSVTSGYDDQGCLPRIGEVATVDLHVAHRKLEP